MGLFNKKRQAQFFVEEPAEVRFDAMMDLVKDLSRKDYNRLKKAMDSGYEAYQTVRGLDANDDVMPQLSDGEFMLHDQEGA